MSETICPHCHRPIDRGSVVHPTINALALALCPTNGSSWSRYAGRSPTGFVEHPGPPRRAEKGGNLAVSANHLISGKSTETIHKGQTGLR